MVRIAISLLLTQLFIIKVHIENNFQLSNVSLNDWEGGKIILGYIRLDYTWLIQRLFESIIVRIFKTKSIKKLNKNLN